jgi:hypothetical protein
MESIQNQIEQGQPVKAERAVLTGGFAVLKTLEPQPVPEHWPVENGDYFYRYEIPFGD